MRSPAYLILIIVACWRVGDFVGWDYKTISDKLSNDSERPYEPPVDTCEINRGFDGLKSRITSWGCAFKALSEGFKASASTKIQEVLPSPHSELVMGMVLGENRFKLVPTYNDVLKKVGLVHVVVVSGYNISLVFTLLIRILGSQYKVKNLIAGLFITFVYAGISGFGIPAVRAWIMGSIAVLFKYYGRLSQGIKILIFSAIVILICAPDQLFSVSFQLSFLATLGVMVLPEAFKNVTGRLGLKASGSFSEDFITSLSAQMMVNPVISYYFGTVSIAALVTNPLVLWVVPVCTIMGGLLVFLVFISPLLSKVLAIIMYPFLDYFVSFSELFAGFNSASLSLRFEPYMVPVYYGVLFLFIRLFKRNQV